ncbi:MAG: glycosyltransferase family 8 protein, partial [Methanocorpusculum sp.]|nr:glycosyltransferase family 8 protein [Methanocorpusculum sp.]
EQSRAEQSRAEQSRAEQSRACDCIHLAVSPWDLTDDYNQHCGVTIASFLDNCHGAKAAVHLLYDEKLSLKNPEGSEANKKKYGELCEKFGAELFYHHVELPEWVYELKSVQKWTPGTLMRLYLPDVEKILYLDCDVVVNTDVRAIWNTSVLHAPLAAVPDSDIPRFSLKRVRLYHSLNIDPAKYFCAGVLLFNLDYLRRTISLSDRSMDILRTYPELPFLDQDILNILFHQSYVHLPGHYNRYMYYPDVGTENGILHYAAGSKPWKSSHGEIDLPYWNYLLQTPWGDDPSTVLCSVLLLPNLAYIREQSFSTLFDQTGLPYTTLMKKIIPAIFSLTRKRIGDFRNSHL